MNWVGNNKKLTIILAVIVLGGIAIGAGSDDVTKHPVIPSSSQPGSVIVSSKPIEAKIGQAVRDGKFEFTVKNIECGRPSVGTNQYVTKTAQGQYCLLNLNVKNIGNEAQGLFSSNQKLLNAQKQQYAADDTATIYAAPNSSAWYSNINPGNSVEGAIVFDIPKDQTPTTAELHDSAFSSGVKVSLQ